MLESYEEHHVADVLVMELVGMKPDAERFTAKTTVLIENVRHHIDEEEKEWFPQVRAGLGRKALQEHRGRDGGGEEEGAEESRPAQCAQEDGRRGDLLIARRTGIAIAKTKEFIDSPE